MDEEYDAVICGTGLKECILSGLLSVHGKKVLHVDRNSYYGGESASVNLTNLFEMFGGGAAPAELGANREWNVDLIPKFVMACGKLVKILLHTGVTRYLDWKVVEGSFVFQHQKGSWFSSEKNIHKVPATDVEALKSPLMSMLEKNRCRSFLQLMALWDDKDSTTWKGIDPNKMTMRSLFEKYGLQDNTIDFIGHAIALHTTDDFMDKPCGPTIERIRLYIYSLSRFGSSPFIYPMYGLGGLPEAFTRLCAIHGGTYMLNRPIDSFVYGADGKVCGVKSTDGEVAKCKMVICDPSYADRKSVRRVGRVVRVICILQEPIPETEKRSSCQIIIPQKQVNRRHDVYVTLISSTHGVAQAGRYIAIVSTTVETDDPNSELDAVLPLIGKIDYKFVKVSDLYEPADDGTKSQVFISSSYDATSHFETAADDVIKIWENIVGAPLDLSAPVDANSLQEQN